MTKRRILIIILALLCIYAAASMIYDSAFPGFVGDYDKITAPRWFVAFVIILLLYPLFIYLREEYNSEYAFEGKNYRIIKLKYVNIDLIKKNDTKWFSEIKQYQRNKENLVAYSKNGALEARSKAKILGIEKYFMDFKSKDEVEKDRGW